MQNHAAPAVATEFDSTQERLPKLRLALPEDLEEVLEMGRLLHAENGLMSLDEAMMRQAAEAAILHKQGIIAVIGKNPIEAMIFLGLRQYWYSRDVHLEELLAYVLPQFRKSDNAKALIEFAKSAAAKLKLPLLIGILSNSRTAQKIRLYQRRLGEPSGAYFIFNGRTGT